MSSSANPFSPDYVSQVKLGSDKYRKPVLNQPPINARGSLAPKTDIKRWETYTRISKAAI